ncbi:MAG: hypothetical protein HC902_08995 [Calothrix sp. SM1_5_4]|nr:hypothetical protein [Calothrix sp. SM1_5_4]
MHTWIQIYVFVGLLAGSCSWASGKKPEESARSAKSASEVKRITVRITQWGWIYRQESYEINQQGGRFWRDDKAEVPAAVVDKLLAAFRRPVLADLDMDNLGVNPRVGQGQRGHFTAR